MIIGFDGSRAFNRDRTGTENYSYQLLKALAKIDQDNQYSVYVRPGIATSGRSIDPPRNDDYEWPENFKFETIGWPRFWTQAGLALQAFKDKLDVLFIPAHTLPLIRKSGLKTVVTVHDLGSEYLPKMHQIKQRLYLSFIQKYQLKTATRIIAVSNATKDDLINKININPQKITVIYEGFDKELFQPIKSDLLVNSLRQYNLKPQSYFLFVGTVQPRKNIERIIKAFSRFCHPEETSTKDLSTSLRPTFVGDSSLVVRNDKSNLVIAGSKGWLSDEIYKLPKILGIEDRVKFLDYVLDKNLPALYSGAKALVFPSLFEGFGLPIVEAQACGCPVITSSISSMPEIAGKGAILVDPYSIEDIVNGMKKMEDGRWKMDMIKLGFENSKRFSWEKCAVETLEVMRSVIPAEAGIHK